MKMRHLVLSATIIVIYAVNVLFLGGCSSDTTLNEFVESVDERLWPYKLVVGTIIELRSSQGNEVVGYVRNDRVELVACKIYGEAGRDEHFLYVMNSEVVAVRRYEINYHQQLVSGPGLEDTCRSLYYLKGSQIDARVDCDSCASDTMSVKTIVKNVRDHFLDTLMKRRL